MKRTFFVLLLLALLTSPEIVFSSDSLQAPQLIAPPDNSVIISDTLFDWTPVPGATAYRIQILIGVNVFFDSIISADSLRINPIGILPGMIYIYWHVLAINQQGYGPSSDYWRFIVSYTDVRKNSETVPNDFYLKQNYPNPFNSETIIEFGVPENDNITLQIFDAGGRLIETLVEEDINAGKYSIKWNANRYSSGVYFCRLRGMNYAVFQKMILLK